MSEVEGSGSDEGAVAEPQISWRTAWIARIRGLDTFLLYSASSLLLQVIVVLSAVVILREVPPELVGIWQSLTLVTVYGDILSLGITRGLNRELPYLLGRGDKEGALALVGTAQFHSIIVGTCGMLALLAVGFFVQPSSAWLLAMVSMGICWMAASYRSYLAVTFRSQTEFRKLGQLQFTECLLHLLTLGLVFRYGYQGMVARYTLIAVIMIILLHRFRPLRVALCFNWRDFRSLLSTGIPLYGSAYMLSASMGFEQTILLKTGGVAAVGLYAPVVAVIRMVVTLKNSIISYTFPRLVQRLGARRDLHGLRRSSVRVALATVTLTLPLVVVGWFVLPPILAHFFPAYAAAGVPCQIALLGSVFVASDTATLSLYALKAWIPMYVYAVTSVALRWFLPWHFAGRMDPLVGVAIGGSVAAALLAVLGMIMIFGVTRTIVGPDMAPGRVDAGGGGALEP